MNNRISITDLKAKKKRGEKHRHVHRLRLPFRSPRSKTPASTSLFIGDTLGMVVLGYDSTIPVTMEEMLHHTKAVVRGIEHAHVLADMPFMSYQVTAEDALRNAGRLLKEGGAQSVKLEGGVQRRRDRPPHRRCRHPRHGPHRPHAAVHQPARRLQGPGQDPRRPPSRLLNDAVALEQAGAYAIVLECVPLHLAKTITDRLAIPTIGIGAGPDCDGQVQVFHDLLGLYQDFVPKHAKRYADRRRRHPRRRPRLRRRRPRRRLPHREANPSCMDTAVFSEAARIA